MTARTILMIVGVDFIPLAFSEQLADNIPFVVHFIPEQCPDTSNASFWLDSAVRATPEKLPLSHAKPTFLVFVSALRRITEEVLSFRFGLLLTHNGR